MYADRGAVLHCSITLPPPGTHLVLTRAFGLTDAGAQRMVSRGFVRWRQAAGSAVSCGALCLLTRNQPESSLNPNHLDPEHHRSEIRARTDNHHRRTGCGYSYSSPSREKCIQSSHTAHTELPARTELTALRAPTQRPSAPRTSSQKLRARVRIIILFSDLIILCTLPLAREKVKKRAPALQRSELQRSAPALQELAVRN